MPRSRSAHPRHAAPRRGAHRRVALAALTVLATGCDAARSLDDRPWHGTPLDPPADAPALLLTGAGGRPYDLATDRGRAVLVFFGYTRCPDVCPTTLADWARARQALGADTARVRFLFVSVDPERDTPDSAAAYARRFHPTFVGVGGTPAQIATVTGAWGISATAEAAAPAEAAPEGATAADPHAAHGAADAADAARPVATLAHTARTFLVDPDGRLRLLHPPTTAPADLAADVRRLLD